MTSYLCDTQVLIWALTSPKLLSVKARNAILKADHEIWVSAASAYEIAFKYQVGKLPAVEPLISSFSRQVANLRASELAVDSTHAIEAGRLDWQHRDPFDRILLAQATIEGLTLITADDTLRDFAPLNTFW
ncbi:type II toxin-antitoxin system VapC family toxin [Arthrobacter russicus]|jgi:PIN domain nuclease of toxin-antitoxin system|uniref:PIN domain nuclease of toxin-antitoxin system n=1 Tax=Arthrobacter russicus TaxID=172040 RepID=A0ABU1JF93_9MICC|nr:type II toxin-antitoxin system VapC family toxin [Arthrobacter russicus]MBQ1444868.1 type II toxin-antitoxin system VapC family toxin [Renibacterium sp.]MDN5667819.1 type II toxin-antitoxin system VapC family toxin [Renibacterium salmoninarum]MDR6270047.1 PIN domain nuclease of toxin-antitoxin system [Arthrobacter russicus]